MHIFARLRFLGVVRDLVLLGGVRGQRELYHVVPERFQGFVSLLPVLRRLSGHLLTEFSGHLLAESADQFVGFCLSAGLTSFGFSFEVGHPFLECCLVLCSPFLGLLSISFQHCCEAVIGWCLRERVPGVLVSL